MVARLPQYNIDNTIRQWGHEIVHLQSGHPELNTNEQVSGCMKRFVRFSLQRFTQADLQARLQEARLSATQEVWAGAFRQSHQFEEVYWRLDNIHDNVEPVIMFSSDVEDGDDDLLLDSDDE